LAEAGLELGISHIQAVDTTGWTAITPDVLIPNTSPASITDASGNVVGTCDISITGYVSGSDNPTVQATGYIVTQPGSVTVMRIGQEWILRSTEQVFAARSVFNIGIDALDATINQNAPDGRFFSWLGQLQWARHIGSGQLIFRSDVQLTDDPLLPIEKFQIGGANSVRGYRENQIVRDWGFSSSLEYRHPVFNGFFGQNKFFVAPFADVGGVWNVDDETTVANDLLVSVGLGVIWEPHRRVHTHVYWGKGLINVHNPENDPQDYGFHFKVSGQFF
jgi:hemolysin activation/secretion protein